MSEKKGIKFSNGKLQWDTLPFEVLEEVIKVLMHGDEKYTPGNWKIVPNFESEYRNALLRHMSRYMQGRRKDEDSGLSVLSHVICNAIFLLWKELQENNNKEYNSTYTAIPKFSPAKYSPEIVDSLNEWSV